MLVTVAAPQLTPLTWTALPERPSVAASLVVVIVTVAVDPANEQETAAPAPAGAATKIAAAIPKVVSPAPSLRSIINEPPCL